MATLYILEGNSVPTDGSAVQLPLIHLPPIASQVVAISGTSAQSAAFNKDTRFVVFTTDTTCSIEVGSGPTATVNSFRLAAGAYWAAGVQPGHKVAVISNS